MNRKLLFAGVVLGGLTLLSIALPVGEWIRSLAQFLRDAGFEGKIAFVAVFFVVTVIPLPLFPFTVLAGFVYGFKQGYLLTLPVTLVGSGCAAVLGSSWLRESVRLYVEKRPGWAAVVRALRVASIRAVVLARLAPTMPFAVQNYVLGAVGVRVQPMVVGTFLAVQPILGAALYVGVVITDLAEMNALGASPELSKLRTVMLVVGLGALLGLVGWLSSVASKALKDMGREPGHSG